MAGTLFVVTTPIGNLGDLSPRAAETLRQVAVVVAEDTRETRKLIHHVGSRVRLLSLHSHSSKRRLEECVELLVAGSDLAFCSDAGTPGVSDPGPALVALARARGVTIIPIPGPSAVHAALAATGWPADRYVFLGFAPRKGGDREAWLVGIRDSPVPVVCFEAGNRTAALVSDIARICRPTRQIMIGREMTKRFEEFRLGSAGALATELEGVELKGEVTLVVERSPPPAEPPAPADRAGPAALAQALIRAGVERSRTARVVADVFGLSRNEGYRLAMEETE